jgi:hypothetical protein
MVGTINRPKLKFISCLPALNRVLGCGSRIKVSINSLGRVGDSTSLSSLDSSISISYTNCTSGLVGTPSSILMSIIIFLGVSGVGCVSNSIGDLSP